MNVLVMLEARDPDAGGAVGCGAGGFERCELDGEVADGGTLSSNTNNLQAGCSGGETVEELILATASHDVEAVQMLTRDAGDIAEDFSVAGSEAMEEEGCDFGSVVWLWVEFWKTTTAELRVDAFRHVAGKQQVGIVDFEGEVEGNDGGGGFD